MPRLKAWLAALFLFVAIGGAWAEVRHGHALAPAGPEHACAICKLTHAPALLPQAITLPVRVSVTDSVVFKDLQEGIASFRDFSGLSPPFSLNQN